jgi:hypothetical protein
MLSGKLFGFCQFTDFEPMRFAQFHIAFDVENSFAASKPNVHVNWPVVVAIKEKSIAVLIKHLGHGAENNAR